MSKTEILLTDVGEMFDMINCTAITEYGAEVERSHDFFDLINLR